MEVDRSRLLERAENARRESKYLEFKREFDTSSAAAWCEVIKDVVAFANSGGGVIVFGINNDGSDSGVDVSILLQLDIADITNKIHRYTDYQFADIEIMEVNRDSKAFVAMIVSRAEVPIVFTRPGTYDVGDRQQKTAFSKGTIYFRHGAKSEPGTRDDLITWRDYALEKIRIDWLGGIRKVVEAPPGHAITVVSSPVSSRSGFPKAQGMAITAKVSAGPGAVQFVPQNAEEIWPYRQKDLLHEVNKELKGAPRVNGHDILCINTHLEILTKHPEFAYKPHKLASPQYNDDYAKWIIAQYRLDPKFFTRMRAEYQKHTARSKH
jgi:Putative DNA-binding domain